MAKKLRTQHRKERKNTRTISLQEDLKPVHQKIDRLRKSIRVPQRRREIPFMA